ncbi:MAG: hypothetical protein IJ776_04290 [Paludibacteraceae bacterium]|nr:hypothetical protein [Paludibacteraceae bacterium]
MKKTIIIAALLGMMNPALAQTSSLQKSPQTLAQEMVQDVAADVPLTAEQTTRLTLATTKYAEVLFQQAIVSARRSDKFDRTC